MRVLSLSALSVCLYLFRLKMTGGITSVAGCGGEGGCAEVMGGPWSEWFHIPVTLGAAGIHLGVLLLTLPSVQFALGRTGDQLLAAAGVILAAAAAYFLIILYFVQKGSCPWCLSLHITGFTVAVILLTDAVSKQRSGGRGIMEAATLTGFMAMCVLSAGQVWGPKPETHLITSQPPSNSPVVPASVATPGAPRVVTFADASLNLKFDTATLPLLGPPEAPVVLVEFFDYTCPSCRDLAGDLKSLKNKWPDSVAVIVLPTPINRMCNPYVKAEVHDHPGACELANLSLTVWRAKPSAFPAFHDYLLSLPLPITQDKIDAARRKALEVAGEAPLNAAKEDPWIAQRLNDNFAVFRELTKETPITPGKVAIKMPKLLLPPGSVMHGTARTTEIFVQTMEKQFNLNSEGSPVVSKPR
ncbi:MAG TPA: vitamin K epoxide reductase family protein [Verrucomicrobiales bacterium]|nr:vitamin K epoxide reductase family protein [Verrucomicrobiales bacterium]